MTADHELLDRRDFLRLGTLAGAGFFASRFPRWLKEPLLPSVDKLTPGPELGYDPYSEKFDTMWGYSAVRGINNKTLLVLTDINPGIETRVKYKVLNENTDPDPAYGFNLSVPGLAQHSGYVASYARPDHFVAATLGVNASGKFEFWAQKIKSDGSLLNEPQLLLGEITLMPFMFEIAPNPNGQESMIVWYCNYPAGYRGAIVSSTGELKANIPAIEKVKIYQNYEQPVVNYNPNTGAYDIVWFQTEDPDVRDKGELCIASINSDGSYYMEPKVLDTWIHYGSKLFTAPDGDVFLALTRATALGNEIVVTKYKDPKDIEPGNFQIIDQGIWDIFRDPDISLKDDQIIMAWTTLVVTDFGMEVHVIRMRTFDKDLNPVSDVTQITPTEDGQNRDIPIIVPDGGFCTVLYRSPYDYEGRYGSPQGRHITKEEDNTSYNYLPLALRSPGT